MSNPLATRLAQALGDAYRLGPEIGRGGMGIVFRATDTRLRRDVAIKVLPPEFSYRDDLRKRFVREAQMAAGLSHPHMVPIYDVGEQDDLVWFVMGYVDGESIRARVEREGSLSQALTKRVVREVAWALAYAHARGIVHRDIKPENILLDRATNRALVSDFGIAKVAEGDTTGLTAPGSVVGSLRYMAPEQAGGESVDGRADLYALGLVAYYMLAGNAPFPNASVMQVALRKEAPDFGALDRRPDPQLRSVLERCTAPHPGDRWPDAERLLEALGPEGVSPPPMPSPIRRLVRDFMLIPAFGLIFVIAHIITPDEPTLRQFVFAAALILIVNVVVSLRSFSRRGFGWPELRDALDMEIIRQREELEATGALRERFRAVMYIAAVGGSIFTLLQWQFDSSVMNAPSLAVWIVMPIGVVIAASLAIVIVEFLGRAAASLLPPLPRPESSSWFSRMEDRLLTILLKPIRFRRSAPVPEAAGDQPGLAGARRVSSEIDRRWDDARKMVPRETPPAPALARQLTARIARLHQTRVAAQGIAERELEALDVASREAETALRQLHAAVEVPDAGGLNRALEAARGVVRRELPRSAKDEEKTPGKRMFPTFTWLGWMLDRMRNAGHPRPTDAIDRATQRINAEWVRQPAVRTAWPDITDRVKQIHYGITSLTMMGERGELEADRAAALGESTAACEAALNELVDALHRYRSGNSAAAARIINEQLDRVREIERRVNALLAAER